ncbi:MAG: hypothetical protein R3Y06_03820 [Faecalibacterium sp.]
MEHRNNENKANNKASNKATNSASNGKHPNQYTKGADDKSAKNANSKNCS